MIDFCDIKNLFSEDLWDVAYLSEENFERSGNTPVKAKFHLSGYDLSNHIHNSVFNGIILARKTEEANNYGLYEESQKLLEKKFDNKQFVLTYLNFKEAALLSGIGSRAKNSLIYNRKFGFQCKFCCYMFIDKIINYEFLSPSKDILSLCKDCNDCIINCPVKAIHEDWIDARKCDNFLGFGNHETISSLKWFWYEKMNPDISKEEVEKWDRYESAPEFIWGQGIDGYYSTEGHVLKKDGVPISIPQCRECVSQPKCSKMPVNIS